MAGQDFITYLDAVKRPFVKLCRLRFLNPDGSTAFALDNNPKRRWNQTFIADGSITVNLQNGQRRTCNIVLDNVNADYDFAYGKIWFGDEVALDEGMILPNGEDFYIPQGIFLFDSPSENVAPVGRTMNYTLVDKWSNLDGSRLGNLDQTMQVAYGTNLFTPITTLLAEDRGNGLPLDRISPVFTDYYNSRTQTDTEGNTVSMVNTCYPLTVEGGNTKADVILGLVGMVNAWVGYDSSGTLRVEPSQDDISDSTKPVLWTFSQDEINLNGMAYTSNLMNVYNDIVIVGEQLENNAQPSGRAQNYDPASDKNINLIGKKTYWEQAAGYGTDTQCEDLAVWKLKRATVLQKTVSITCTQLLHLQENCIVEIERTDKVDRPVERHLIQGFSRPLVGNSPMTINAISVLDFPNLTVTTGGAS